MSLFDSKVHKAANVIFSEKKYRINPPEGWEEEEKRKQEEEQAQAERESADLRARELTDISILKDQIISEGHKEAAAIRSASSREANRLAEQTIKEAKAQSDSIREEARNQGYEDGAAEGAEEGERLMAEAHAVLEDAKQKRDEMIENLEPQLVEMVMDIAEKLLHTSAAYNPQLVICLIRAGLMETVSSNDITVRVSADDYEAVNERKEELLRLVGGGAKLEITRDVSLNKSDCVIETAYGYIDCSLSQQLDALKENLYLLRNL